MSPSPTLSVVIVSWNVRTLLEAALHSVLAFSVSGSKLEVIVVDNASTDGTVEMVGASFPQVRLIANRQNLGFTGGNNQGISAAKGDYILLLNSDAELLDGALDQMIHYLEMHPDVGLVGPQLLNSDGSHQSSRRRFPTPMVLFLESTWLEGLAPRSSLDRYYCLDRSPTERQEVDWVTGAAMMVRREVVDQVGPFDEGFFMYSEELDWCRRIRNAGWRIVYVPEAKVVHHGGKSSDQVAPARHIYFQSSKVRYTRKYHGGAVAELLRVWLLAQYAWQTAVEATKWLLGHRRDLRAARVKAYLRVIRSGLRVPAICQHADFTSEEGSP
ncbi:MAG: glycosyltransferase family 2 protein [Anaerolineae bacterium]